MKYLKEFKQSFNTTNFKVGSYTLSATLIVLCILIAINTIVVSLDSKYTQLDMSAAKLYSLTTQSKAIASSIEEEVNIYWVVQSGQEDAVLSKLLERYDDLSENLNIIKKDPDIYPTFVSQYVVTDYENNCLIVESGDKNRYIAYDDIYETDYTDYYSSTTSFDGEGAITSAIDYVTSDDLPTLYLLEGHGEAELTDSLASTLEKENINTTSLSLISINEIPEDCDAIFINGPQSDISNEEYLILSNYLDNGGRLIVLDGPTQENTLTQLETILSDYDVTTNEGIIIEGDQTHYGFSVPYMLLPDIQTHEITTPLLENNYYAILPISKGFTISDTLRDALTVTELLSTSTYAFSKVDGYALTTYEQESNDISGPFSLGVAIEENDTKMIWYGSSALLDETYDTYSSGANTDLFLNSLSWLIDEENTISIRSKSLDYDYLVVDSDTAQIIKVTTIGLIPLSYLCVGIYISLQRRKL